MQLERYVALEFMRTGAFLTLFLGTTYITGRLILFTVVSPHVATWVLLLAHAALIIAWLVHYFIVQGGHVGKVLGGKAKGLLKEQRLPRRWEIGYGIGNVLFLLVEWWWTKTLIAESLAKKSVATINDGWLVLTYA